MTENNNDNENHQRIKKGDVAAFTKIMSGSPEDIFRAVTDPNGFGLHSYVIGDATPLDLWVFNGHIDWNHFLKTGVYIPGWIGEPNNRSSRSIMS